MNPSTLATRWENWVPPLIVGEKDTLNPRKNPFWAHAECQHYLAWRGTEVVALGSPADRTRG